MTNEEKLKYCKDCDNDFYNGRQNITGNNCWNLESAQRVVRYKIHWWTAPTVPNAYQEVITNSCHTESGKYAFHKKLPDFVTEYKKDYLHE